jgi:hypothetical protein
MITLYLNHFRGFEATFIPLDDVTFLVGENSTGKTSVLTALRVLCGYSAWVLGRFQVGDEGLGGFSDFASNGVPWFQIGYVRHQPTGENHYDAVLVTFTGRGSLVPWVLDVQLRTSSIEVRFHHAHGALFYRKQTAVADAMSSMREWVKQDPVSEEGLVAIDEEVPNPFAPLGMITASFASESRAFEEAMDEFMKHQADRLDAMVKGGTATASLSVPPRPSPLPMTMNWTDELEWLAPIRAGPRRSYDSVAQSPSPEGDHVPWRIRGLSDRSKLREGIRDYGQKSGLYDDIETRKFGDTEDAPFELRVRLGDRAPNLVNVGYGVSQALPVVTSLLDPGRRGAWYALQQPEVHLHPRAQAALGELLFDMALAPHWKRFLVETHSDYVVDRFRHRMRKAAASGAPVPSARVLFFERIGDRNVVHAMPLAANGDYPEAQPEAFRKFFLEEELQNLGY